MPPNSGWYCLLLTVGRHLYHKIMGVPCLVKIQSFCKQFNLCMARWSWNVEVLRLLCRHCLLTFSCFCFFSPLMIPIWTRWCQPLWASASCSKLLGLMSVALRLFLQISLKCSTWQLAGQCPYPAHHTWCLLTYNCHSIIVCKSAMENNDDRGGKSASSSTAVFITLSLHVMPRIWEYIIGITCKDKFAYKCDILLLCTVSFGNHGSPQFVAL